MSQSRLSLQSRRGASAGRGCRRTDWAGVMIHVIGGCYREICMSPEVSQYYGSAGRAATALAARTEVRLHTFVGPRGGHEVKKLGALGGFEVEATSVGVDVSFGYVHPLHSTFVSPARGSFQKSADLQVDAGNEIALVFGAYEGTVAAKARTIVYDPQDGIAPVPYNLTGCRAADRLAIIMNTAEAFATTGTGDVQLAGTSVLRETGADVVIVKSGQRGALVFGAVDTAPVEIPAFFSRSMFGIGTGDVFAAAFTYFWAECGEATVDAARKASQAVSHYVETRSDRLPSDENLGRYCRAVSVTPGRVYLAGPFFTMAKRWLVEEARDQLMGLGLHVFSPVHDVGKGPASVVAPLDLAGLDSSDRVFAIVDGLDAGTIFEVGYARKLGLPVYCYGETIDPEDSKMITGSGCHLIADFATAIYHTAWKC